MLCERCQSREAVAKDGQPVACHLFGEIHGCFCADCLLDLQRPYDDALRAAIAHRVPSVSAEELARMPDQMLKFTLCLPIPPVRGVSQHQ
jgi:hypothetical protein